MSSSDEGTSPGSEHPGTDPHVGSLAEEAAKLAGAFAAWAVDQGARTSHQVHDLGAAFVDSAHEHLDDLDEHLATGAPECTTCPICRTVAAVREVSPEVKQHLGAAAGSLISAASGFLAAFHAAGRPTPAAQGEDASAAASDGVERIDLDE